MRRAPKANPRLIQRKDEINPNPAKVGEAAFKLLSKEQTPQEVGETINAITPRYYDELFATIDANEKRFESPFFIVVLRKKEGWTINVLRQWFVARQTKPSARILREDYPNHDHDVWCVNPKEGKLTLEWTLPTAQDSLTILKNKDLYDASLVKWIQEFNENRLN